MANYTGLSISDPSLTFGGVRLDKKLGVLCDGVSGPTTTYYYREENGSRGTTTDAAAVPATAVIERQVTA